MEWNHKGAFTCLTSSGATLRGAKPSATVGQSLETLMGGSPAAVETLGVILWISLEYCSLCPDSFKLSM